MKILIINSRYFLSAGPEKYLFSIRSTLEAHGHKVIPFSVKNSNNDANEYERYFAEPIGGKDKVYFRDYNKNFSTILALLGRQFYSFHVKRKLGFLIEQTRPDVAYVLHHANKLSPSVIDACRERRIPVVVRLSDFSLVCPAEHLYRDGIICEECVAGTLWNCVAHRCVKHSILASAIKALALFIHRLLRLYEGVAFFVSPSAFTLTKVSRVAPNERLIHLPTLVVNTEPYNDRVGDYILYVGRLEEHKGVLDAVSAIQGTDYHLLIIGASSTGYDKVLHAYISNNNIQNATILGPKFGNELRDIYRNARCVVIPTIWYENLPNVALEAMSFSRPIVAPKIASIEEFVVDDKNGLLYEYNNALDMRRIFDTLFGNGDLCRRLGLSGYQEVVDRYSPEAHYQKLLAVFRNAMSLNRKQ